MDDVGAMRAESAADQVHDLRAQLADQAPAASIATKARRTERATRTAISAKG